MTLVRLHPEVVCEPLVWHWHAWGMLISPHTAALFLKKKLLPLLNSFVQAPDFHKKACQQIEFSGGSFVDLPLEATDQVKSYISDMEKNFSNVLDFAEDLQMIQNQVLSEVSGYSLDHLYSEIPSSLKGFVEICYDWLNSPQIRFIEPLLYKFFYDSKAQKIALSHPSTERRPFLLSTPRLSKSEFYIHEPFSSPSVDLLARSRYEAMDSKKLIDGLKIHPSEEVEFLKFFTPSCEYHNNQRKVSSELKVTYIGHACVLIEFEGESVLIDPLVGYGHPSPINKKTLDDIPDKIDYVLISHAHQDHLVLETLIQLRPKIRKIIVPRSQRGSLLDPSLKLILNSSGFENVSELDEFESISSKNLSILALPFFGEHAELMISSKVGFLLTLGGFSFLFAADSNNISPELYNHINKCVGSVDYIFLGMECEGAPGSWLYGPLFPKKLEDNLDKSRRLNGSNAFKAIHLIKSLKPKSVFVYAMGREPWLSFLTGLSDNENSPQLQQARLFKRQCQNDGIPCEILYGSTDILSQNENSYEYVI